MMETVARADGTTTGGVNLGGKAMGGSDDWGTDPVRWAEWDEEFGFMLDVAANAHNALSAFWFGPGSMFEEDALADNTHWGPSPPDGPYVAWCNPPFSLVAKFAEKANNEAAAGRATTVLLCKVVCDTRWWHRLVWDIATNAFRPGVAIRFIKGRVKFVGAKDPAPFPICLLIFRAGETVTTEEAA